MNLDSSVDRLLLPKRPVFARHPGTAGAYPADEAATGLLARPDGRLTLSLLLAGISLLRRRFASCIPSGRTNNPVQPRNPG